MELEDKIQRIVENAKYCGVHSREATRQILLLLDVVGRSELLNAFLDYADPIYWAENECTDRRQLIDQFLKSIQ